MHWYNKGDARRARKMGHINIVGASMADVEARLRRIAPELTLPPRAPLVGIIMGSDSDLPVMRTAAGPSGRPRGLSAAGIGAGRLGGGQRGRDWGAQCS